MAKLSQIGTNQERVHHGIWATYPGTDVRCRIASTQSPKFQAAKRRLLQTEQLNAVEQGVVTEDDARRALAPAVAECLLLEVQNLEDDEGQPIQYTVAKGIEILRMPEMTHFYEWVLRTADNVTLYRNRQLEEDQGN